MVIVNPWKNDLGGPDSLLDRRTLNNRAYNN